MTVRFLSFALLITLFLAPGCVRRTTVQDFGLPNPIKRAAIPPPDKSIRAVFQQQTKGAFNPLADDRRIQTLQDRLTNNPGDAEARLEFGSVYESYRLYDEALEQYTSAFGLSRSEKALMGIVRCDQALNRTWQAIPLIEQFLKETSSAAVWNLLGLMYDASGDLFAGERALREAVEADPLSDQWHNNLGYNLMSQKKTDAAESEFRRALELNPKSVTTHNNLGILLTRRGELQAGLAEFQFGADTATAHNNVAVVLMEMGKYEESRQQLVKALAARRYFSPALSNFKLVQERIRQRTEIQKAGKLPQTNIRIAAGEQEASQIKKSQDK